MTHSPMRPLALSIVACSVMATLGTAGCARHAPAVTTASPDSTPAHPDPTPLHVINSNWSDVRIYIVRGGMWLRLGMVTTNGSGEFTVPLEFLSSGGSATLVAAPVAGWSSWTAPLPPLHPGDELELVVENLLQYSHLVVR